MPGQISNVQPNLFKKHTEEEAAILEEYIRITNREDLDLCQRIAFLLLDSRTNLAFFVNVCCFVFTLYLSGSRVLRSIDLLDVASSYLFADLLSGIVHIYLDHSRIRFDGSYVDFARMGFQVHHFYPTFPWMMDPQYRPHLECNTIFVHANLVALVNALTVNVPTVPVGCFFAVSFQATHYWAHAKTHGKGIPWVVSKLQDLRIIISPRRHQQHHTEYTSDFCIFNGFMNGVCDWIVSDERRVDDFVAAMDQYPEYVALLVVVLVASGLMCLWFLRWTFHIFCGNGTAASMLTMAIAILSMLAFNRYGNTAAKAGFGHSGK